MKCRINILPVPVTGAHHVTIDQAGIWDIKNSLDQSGRDPVLVSCRFSSAAYWGEEQLNAGKLDQVTMTNHIPA